MTLDDAAVQAIGCVPTEEALAIDFRAAQEPEFAAILERHRQAVARLDILMATSSPLPRPEVWERIAQSLD